MKKLRWHLAALVLASVVPLVVFAVVVLGRVQREQRASFEQELMQVTRGRAMTIDRDLLGVTTALQTLASSTLLDDGRLSAFHRRANALLAVHEGWHDVVLIDPRALKTLMSVRRPIGSEPIATEVSDTVRRVIAHRRPMISDGFTARDSGRLVVALLVPVERGGQMKYVLGAQYEPAVLMTLVADHGIPHLWAVGIVDGRNVTIARSRGVEFVGKPANPLFVQKAPASGVVSMHLGRAE